MLRHTYDILGLGIVAVDDLLYVESYPPPDSKTQVMRSERQCGGLTATALVAAARLGAKCAYAGVLGDDDLSRFVEDTLLQEGIDLSHAVRKRHARPAHSTIIVDTAHKTRAIFFEISGATGADVRRPSADVIRSTRVLFVDHYGVAGMLRAAHIARQTGIPVVADLERNEHPRFSELLALVDHLILAQEFARKVTGERSVREVMRALWTENRSAVVVTCGVEGCWYAEEGTCDNPAHFPAFRVQTVDTTGCGDVFHGAYASALAQGLSLPDRVRFASAAAAMKAMQPGGQAGVPDRRKVETFLQARGMSICTPNSTA